IISYFTTYLYQAIILAWHFQVLIHHPTPTAINAFPSLYQSLFSDPSVLEIENLCFRRAEASRLGFRPSCEWRPARC
ncbi:hypothetical protein, partial [Staphylococcus aureus]